MRLRYAKKDGTQMEFELGDRPITIGRSPDADVVVLDEKASRLHCGIRLWDGDFYIKDLKSRNGTFVNGQQIEMCKLKPGDRIRVGSTTFLFEQEAPPPHDQALKEMQKEMAEGKGYSTLLQEIVEELPGPVVGPAPPAAPATEFPARPAPAAKPKSPPPRRIIVRKTKP